MHHDVYIILIEIRTDIINQLKTKKYYPKKCIAKKTKDVQKLHQMILNNSANQSKNENEENEENENEENENINNEIQR
jgi:hypothetical protein